MRLLTKQGTFNPTLFFKTRGLNNLVIQDLIINNESGNEYQTNLLKVP